MTFWAQKNPTRERQVDVNVTYGPIAIKVTEDIGHLRSFWGELGRLLEDVEKSAEV